MSLSTLIVQREIASIREVEEALARQVLYGGDLITNLLEVCRLDEAQLLPIVAESLGLPPAPPGELPRPDKAAMRLIAAEVANERNLAPLSVDRYGLVIAVAEPLSADVDQELSFALALPIPQKIAPLVRIRQALTRDYALPLDKRFQRLLIRMTSDGPRGGSSFPPMRNADMRFGAPRPPSNAPVMPQSKQPPAVVVIPASARDGQRTFVRMTEVPAVRPLRRRRGAITVDVARTELEEAGERDTIFDLLFEFARQYFDYTAVFILHGEIAEGRDAFGDGAAREKVSRIGVPLDMPSILSIAREKKATIQRVPASDGLDAILMNDLGRPGKTVCIVLPVVVRGRVVAMLLGDGGEAGIDNTTLVDVEGVIAQASAAFERLIVRRKLKGTMPPGANDSVLPYGLSAPPPPTKHSEISERLSVEELAPPIRELMMEPVSRMGETIREPHVQAVVPPEASTTGAARKTETAPPSPNILAVRRPSGAPIPREEPDSYPQLTTVTAPSNLGPAALLAQAVVSGAIGAPSSRLTRGHNPRREAPKLEFGAVPPPSSFLGEPFGTDNADRQLLDEITAPKVEAAPATSRDEAPPRVSPSGPPSPMSVEVEPPPSVISEPPPQSPHSPGSRGSITAPFRPGGTTEISPGALPMFAPGGAVPGGEPPLPESVPISSGASSGVLVDAADSDVSIVDEDPTPLSPMVDMDGLTPLLPPVSAPASPVVSAATTSPRVPPIPGSSRAMPPSEQQISVAAHRPPSSRSDNSSLLPSVIVDVASEYVELVDRVLAWPAEAEPGRPSADDAENELLRAGGYAMPAIMARFPGPMTIERDRLNDGPLPRVAECGPVLRLIASQRRTALPFVLAYVEDPDVEKRFWATYLLTELVYPDVLEPILKRVHDQEARVRRVARAAARAFADAHPSIIVERLEVVAMDGGESRHRRILAIEALGETREGLAVPALIPLLDDPAGDVVSAVRVALITIARQDFGSSSQRWSAWWTENYDRHRLEWLIDALMHDQAALRAAAGEELKTTTKEYFGYYDDLPKRERERAQSRYREWWNSVGRVRFSRSSSSRG